MTFADDIPSAIKEYVQEHAEETDIHVQISPQYKPTSTITQGYKAEVCWHDPVIDDFREVATADVDANERTTAVLMQARDLLEEAEEEIGEYRRAAAEKGL